MTPMTIDVAVIGGGPSGLAAARELRLSGAGSVVVFERESAAGGVPRFCDHGMFGLVEFGRLMTGSSYAKRLVDRAVACGVSVLTGHSVVDLGSSGRLRVASTNGILEVQSKRIIISTGARESSRAERFLSGDRPLEGCLTTGALQSILLEHRAPPFQRPLILGTEFVSLSAIWTCRHAGIYPVAIVEERTQPLAGAAFRFLPRLLGIPLFLGAKVVQIRGTRQVESVAVRLSNGNIQAISCDGLLCTGSFVPESAILHTSPLTLDPETRRPSIDSFGRCSIQGYFAIGNVSHAVKTASYCYREGRRIGRNVAEDLLGRLPDR